MMKCQGFNSIYAMYSEFSQTKTPRLKLLLNYLLVYILTIERAKVKEDRHVTMNYIATSQSMYSLYFKKGRKI